MFNVLLTETLHKIIFQKKRMIHKNPQWYLKLRGEGGGLFFIEECQLADGRKEGMINRKPSFCSHRGHS